VGGDRLNRDDGGYYIIQTPNQPEWGTGGRRQIVCSWATSEICCSVMAYTLPSGVFTIHLCTHLLQQYFAVLGERVRLERWRLPLRYRLVPGVW
jgi:hypothetical protein